MRKSLPLLLAPVLMVWLLAGCSSSMVGSSGSALSANSTPVSLSMTDDPPAGVSVLFFQVSLTDATLTPASGSPVSLLNNNTPIQIDVTQLQALSAFLSTANVAAGTYNSLSLTFANPDLVIFNKSNTAIASTCAVGTVCEITPTMNSATLNFTTSPFPLTLSASSPLGLMVDFHLNKVVQPDLSVNLSVTNGVTVEQMAKTPKEHLGHVTGTVQSVNASQNSFTMLTRWGWTLTIDTGSSTTFSSFPASACTTQGFGCVAQGQVVRVDVSSIASGVVQPTDVTYMQEAGQQMVEGTIIGLSGPTSTNTSAPWTITMILHRRPFNDDSIPMGGQAQVTVDSGTTFAVDAQGAAMPAGVTFASGSDLYVGQNIQVVMDPGSMSAVSASNMHEGWGPARSFSFTTKSVQLEPSQVTGVVTTIGKTSAGDNEFDLGLGFGPWFADWPMAMSASNTLTFHVVPTASATYRGFTPDDFTGITTNDMVSVRGWLFAPASSGDSPTIVATSVVSRPGRDF